MAAGLLPKPGTWRSFVGGKLRTFEEYEIGSYATEVEARAAAVARGATLRAEKMQGAVYYNAHTGESFRVTARGWAPGYVLRGVREIQVAL